MTTFFIDLWHDLREKRLWPVAVGLLAAIVAVPAILFKPSSDAAPAPVVAQQPGGADTLPAVSVENGPTVGSRLEAFNEKNPFKPMKDLEKTAGTDPGSSASGADGAASGSSSDSSGSSSSAGGGSSSSGGSTGSGSTGGGSTSSDTPPSSSTPSSGGGTTVQWFRYTADFNFGEPGAPKKFESPSTLTLLPDEKSPAIVFMGVTDDHKGAVFFISDPGFEAAGEGKCNASGSDCRFVTLKLSDSRNEETFSAVDGSVSYEVKLLKIQREDVDTDSSGNPVPPASSRGKGLGATDEGVTEATQTGASVLPALIADGPGIAREER
jgi:hypothetical protein